MDVLLGDAVLTVERDGQLLDIKMPADIGNVVTEHKANEFVQPRMRLSGVLKVEDGSPAEKMGLAVGDSIVAINGQAVAFFDEFRDYLVENAGEPVELTVLRGDQQLTLSGTVSSEGRLGFAFNDSNSLPVIHQKFGFWESLPLGTAKAFNVVTDNIKGFGKIFKGELRADKALSGPVGIAQLFGTEVDWVRFWGLVGLISMALAFMNLLPIPALDGGHVVFLLIEMIQGKPLSDAFLEKAQMVGFFILVALMIFVFGNDIFKLTQ